MSYEVAQVLTVSLFYLNSLTDPLIFLLYYPRVTAHIKGSCGKMLRRVRTCNFIPRG